MIRNLGSCQVKFEIDEYLYKKILEGNTVLFAGAGISTESKTVKSYTLYDEAKLEVKYEKNDLSFPDLMEKFVSLPDGRKRLIQLIQKRFDNIESFGSSKNAATNFHRELATLFPIQTIITTNWDLFFEKYTGAIPFTHEDDMAFWNDMDRNLLKIHGSISNYGSLIATARDYRLVEEKLNKGGLIGSKLKSLLAEKNIIFIGYSFSDSDFQKVYKFVKNTLGEFHNQSYVITPFKEEAIKFKKFGLIPIITDGTYFIREIKNRAIQENILLPDSIYIDAEELLYVVNQKHYLLHSDFDIKKYPHISYCAAYQDGMMDALTRILTYRKKGTYSDSTYIPSIIDLYEKIVDKKEKEKMFLDSAYVQGYLMGLMYIYTPKNMRPTKRPPFYYLRTIGPMKFKKFKKLLFGYKNKYKSEFEYVEDMVKKFPKGYTYHHIPEL